ncbi:hypothetical protein [Paenibacillus jiagnxiensis]|uniref:hypothetical protein n=1 Tax=Paenibacillus jiagnxiensis TaxID=3228926 RepID=UPI0033A5D959
MIKRKFGEIKTLTESDKQVIQKMVDTLSRKTVDAPVMSIAFTKSKWNSDDVPGSLKTNILNNGVEIG